ncbi:ABC transporter ATP-binding protein [Breznakiella homolactica]|uniref:ABC transporter ATP-binding protein n=1 Tax=Breznakiella homolactica TaxID=2798577 RepID=A0A7T8BCJ6_9SPIR|nr:ABC transporter ATP-binding protein [Breznakiella homolactica]QQO11195.1 ABC transporter ATP-binding protein [Breznakiella homolactica]
MNQGHLVEYRGFRAAFGSGESAREVIHGIDFHIDEHETFALVGESGSGKTVSAQALMRLLSEEWIRYPGGEILFQGRNVLAMNSGELEAMRGKEMGMIFQEPMTSLNPLHRIEKQLAESLFLHQGLSAAAARPVVLDWLSRVGLRDAERRLGAYPHELSGGERQRVMIALALINKPKLLIADEPTTALDVTIQAQILALIRELQRELGMAVLFITHDLGIVRSMADRVAVMRDGNIIETGTTGEIFRSPRESYTKLLISSDTGGESPVPDDSAPVLAEVRDMKVYYPVKKGFLRRVTGYIKAVDGVDFTLRKGQTLGLVGESGSGKTTLGKAILRLEKSSGTIILDGREIQNLSEKELRPLRHKMQIIFQDPYGSLSPRMTVEDIVGEGLLIHGIGTKEERKEKVISALGEVGMGDEDFLARYPNEFSGGQRQRIALARSLVLEPELLVLDEPTSSLDRTIQFQVVSLLKELQERRGLSYIFISHDLRVVRSLCHYILIMKDGKAVEAGPAEEIMRNPKEPYTQELLRTAFGE